MTDLNGDISDKSNMFRTFSIHTPPTSQLKNNQASKTSSTLTQENKSKIEKKSMNHLSSISEETPGFGSFKTHKHADIFDDQQDFCPLPEQELAARKKISNLHNNRNFGRSFTLEEHQNTVTQGSKLTLVSGILLVGFIVFILINWLQPTPQKINKARPSSKRPKGDKKGRGSRK